MERRTKKNKSEFLKNSKLRRRTMKKLLTGKLEGCPAHIFEKQYNKIRTENFKNKYGIYALYDKKANLYYVGHASDLSGRLNQHLKHNRNSGKWDYFSVYFTKTKEMAFALEAVILSICPPKALKGNKKTAKLSKVAKDITMRDRIEKQMKKIDKERRQFKKPGLSAKNKKEQGGKASKSVRKIASQDGAQKRRFQLKDFFSNGFLSGRHTLRAEYKAKTFYALLLPSGEIEYQGKKYSSPSFAAKVAKKSQSENGWTVWKIQDKSNKWITLDALRSEALGFKANTKPIDKAS